jgi:hypothetical protein
MWGNTPRNIPRNGYLQPILTCYIDFVPIKTLFYDKNDLIPLGSIAV